MKEVAISEFKAKCLGILEEVRKTRKPIRVTRFGKPVAEVVPPSPGTPNRETTRVHGGHGTDRRRYCWFHQR
jgi:prevent-host-death family protein